MSSPKDYLLSSFNALNIEKPVDIFYQSIFCLSASLPDDQVYTQDALQSFDGKYQSEYTAQTLQTTYTKSFGLEADYAKVSGDAQTNYTDSKYTQTTSFNSSYYSYISCGVTSLKDDDSAYILSTLKPDLVNALNGITTAAQAKAFTDSWGTHLITSVKLGGSLFIAIQSATMTEEDRQSVENSVSASYQGAGNSITATAKAAQEVATTSTKASVDQQTAAVGGSAVLASSINCLDPSTFQAWANSCTSETVQALNKSVTFFNLLPAESTARSVLERYVQIALLAKSLNHPSYLHRTVQLEPYKTFTVSVATDEGERILCGEAALSDHSNSFLMGSFSNLDSTGESRPGPHRPMIRGTWTGTLTAYAFPVYDPTVF
ncbi:MAC/perforin domain-containing protein [Azospirillum sp. B506]|uniref:MAC/perforin domain-containing protein n=1 Tax=Azospirillum sp. B506 TaxID=137721 RepID=UPI0009FEAA00|nr:MAC/perforin domain-containing protein [Azospirillum sp. B506]